MKSRVWLPAMVLGLTTWSCTMVREGIEVDIAYATPATPQAVLTDSGYRVWLERALMVLGPVELIECESAVRDLWRLFTVATARAHIGTASTSLSVPLVLDLMDGDGTAFYVGTIRPPPGRYCGMRIAGGPANEETVGAADSPEMLQSSILVVGEIEDRETQARTPWAATVPEVLVHELWFEEALVFDSPRSVSVSVEIDHMQWFDGIDFAELGARAVQQKLVENVGSSMAVSGP